MDKPKVLFLTPFHFETADHDDEFDVVLGSLLNRSTDCSVVVTHVEPFESEAADYDRDQSVAVVDAVKKANGDGFDAVIIGCHYDPALDEARAASTIPVIGPLQLTTGIATQLGPKFAVVTDIPEAVPVIRDLVEGYGYGDSCTGVRAIDWEGDAILDDPAGAAAAVDQLVAELAEVGEIQSVLIGCTIVSSAYERYRDQLPARGVTVLNTNLLSVEGATALVAT